MNSWLSGLKTRKAALFLGTFSFTALVLWYYYHRKVSQELTRVNAHCKLSLGKQKAPVVVVGPSGVGKGTLLKKVREEFVGKFAVAVSHTTRSPREGELDGISYHFITQEKFQDMISNNEFVEYAQFGTNFYGTSFQAVKQVAKENQICILEIDLKGAQIIKKIGMECKFIFIKTSGDTVSIVRQRLQNRATESMREIDIRVEVAKEELEYFRNNPGFFDYVVVNDCLDDAAKLLCIELSKWYQLPMLDMDWNMI